MSLRFEQPVWLWLIVLCVPVAWAGLRWFRSMSAARRWSAVVLRVLLIALIVGMLAGASAVRRSERLAVVAVVDVSGSVQQFADFGATPDGRRIRAVEAARRFLADATRARGPDDLLGVVLFDGEAVAVATPSRTEVLDRLTDATMAEGTNIARALELAAALFPPDASRRIVLFSDGNETAGNALEAAQEIAALGGGASAGGVSAGGVPIDVVPISYRVTRETLIESVDAPMQATAESVVTVRVVLESTDGGEGTLYLQREGELLDISPEEPGFGRKLRLGPGRHVELVSVRLDGRRIHRFEAIFEPDEVRLVDGSSALAGDTIRSNNRGRAFTITPGRGSVLLVDGVGGGDPRGPGMVLPRTLGSAGIEVEVVSPEGVPADLLSLQAYDLVILQNVAADAVPRTLHSALVSYVNDLGGGLVMVGGPDSFGAGGWKGTDLEPILPVRLDLPERLVMPSAAIVFVLDNSGSMNASVMGSARSQQDIANEGAALAVETLDPTDLVGVIVFNSAYSSLVPLGPNRDAKRTASIIRAISSGGGTNLPPALAEAHRQLAAVDAQLKHIIVLSDGASQGTEILPELASRIAADGIAVSSIAVGDGADTQTLREIADRGQGRYYRVADPSILPRIFVRAVRIVRTPLIRAVPFTPVVLPTGSPLVDGIGDPPPLGGLVLTQVRDDPTVTNAMLAPQGEPVLAHWNAGLGRVAAFTSDAHEWAARWIDWPGYTAMWTQIARTIARPQADRKQELTVEIAGDRLAVRLDAFDDQGRPMDLLTVPAVVYAPGGERTELRLAQTGPGVYEGQTPAPSSGNYVVTLTPRQGERRLAPLIGGASRATGVEYRRLRSNVALLHEIADITGGRPLDIRRGDEANLFDRSGIVPSEAKLPLWRTLLVWAVVVMLLDVATRRIAWDRLLSREFGATLRREAAATLADRGREAAATLAQLRRQPEADGAPPASAATLSSEDAKRLAAAQAARRKAERQAQRRAAAEGPAVGGQGAAPQRASEPGDPKPSAAPDRAAGAREGDDTEATTSGLLAAKRRARERYGADGGGSTE